MYRSPYRKLYVYGVHIHKGIHFDFEHAFFFLNCIEMVVDPEATIAKNMCEILLVPHL